MAIPDYQTLMLPVLKLAGDGQEHRIGEVIDRLARVFGLTEDEQQQLLPSGKQSTFANRVGWAKSYLVQAALLEATKRAHFRITDRGRKSLADAPAKIDNNYLSQFPEFLQFRERGREGATLETPNVIGVTAAEALAETPDELLRSTVRQIEAALTKELLDRILAAPPAFFEGLIVALLVAMGYGGTREKAGRILGRSVMGALTV